MTNEQPPTALGSVPLLTVRRLRGNSPFESGWNPVVFPLISLDCGGVDDTAWKLPLVAGIHPVDSQKHGL